MQFLTCFVLTMKIIFVGEMAKLRKRMSRKQTIIRSVAHEMFKMGFTDDRYF